MKKDYTLESVLKHVLKSIVFGIRFFKIKITHLMQVIQCNTSKTTC